MPADETSDAFELYDLRVEVVARRGRRRSIAAPSPATISSCAARCCICREGQGFSIYSLAALLPLLPAKQRPTHPNDWMSTDAEVACPDPNCPTRLRITRTRHAAVPAMPKPPPCRFQTRRTMMETVRPRRRPPHLPRHPRRLAAGRRPWRGRPGRRAIADLVAFADAGITTFDCADIYTGVEEIIGAFRAVYGRGAAQEALDRMQGPHQVRARSRQARPLTARPTSRRPSTLR